MEKLILIFRLIMSIGLFTFQLLSMGIQISLWALKKILNTMYFLDGISSSRSVNRIAHTNRTGAHHDNVERDKQSHVLLLRCVGPSQQTSKSRRCCAHTTYHAHTHLPRIVENLTTESDT